MNESTQIIELLNNENPHLQIFLIKLLIEQK